MKKIEIAPSGYGHFKIETVYYGKPLTAITTNTIAIDRYNSDEPNTRDKMYNTRNQAALDLYDEILRANDKR